MTFINGVIFACSTALAGGLLVIMLFRWTMRMDPSLDQSLVQGSLPLGELLRNLALFAVLAIVAGLTLRAEIKRRSWLWAAEAVLAFTIAAVMVFMLADPAQLARDLGIQVLAAGIGLAGWAIVRLKSALVRTQRQDPGSN
jgi:hypothetical protein